MGPCLSGSRGVAAPPGESASRPGDEEEEEDAGEIGEAGGKRRALGGSGELVGVALELGHFLHHVHEVLGAAHLLEHARVHGLVELLHDVVGVALHLLGHVGVAVLHEAGLAHFGDDALELLVAPEEHVDLHGVGPGAAGDAVESGGGLVEVDAAVELVVSHGVHHVHEASEAVAAVVVGAPGGDELRDAGDHGHDLVQGAELHDVLELLVHVSQSEDALGELLDEVVGLVLVAADGVLDLLDEAAHVPHAEEAGDEGAGVEGLEVVEVLAGSEEDDGRARRGDRRERATALGVAVQFGDDDRADLDGLVEGLGLVPDRLALRRVEHEDDLVGRYRLPDLLHLLEQRRLLPMPARGVDDDHLVLVLPELGDPLLGDLDGICLAERAVERTSQLGRVLPQLVVGPRAKRVRAHHAALPPFSLVVVREFRDRRRLPRALESHEHDNVALAFLHLVRLASRVQHPRQLIHERPLDRLAPIRPRCLLLQVRPRLDRRPQLAHDLHVHVRLQQGPRHLPEHPIDHLLAHHRHRLHLVQRRRQLRPQLPEHHLLL
mmetsp:Transcript_18724/g.58872  ORF Transcript_18724/g.58872 Transcript_18724/m.58872 type:complete len:549 (+) Transcript_18724:619-2265(+)